MMESALVGLAPTASLIPAHIQSCSIITRAQFDAIDGVGIGLDSEQEIGLRPHWAGAIVSTIRLLIANGQADAPGRQPIILRTARQTRAQTIGIVNPNIV